MAAITTRLRHLRPIPRPNLLSVHHFSSDDDAAPPQPDPEPTPENQINKPASFSSYFSEVKASLQQQQPTQAPRFQQPRPSPQSPISKNSASLEEIRRNLSEFRLRNASPSSATQQVLFKQVFNNSKDPPAESTPHLSSLADRVRQLTNSGAVGGGGGGGQSSYINRLRSNLGQNTGAGGVSFPPINSGGDRRLPLYNTSFKHFDLGKKLQTLRPDKREGKWFSLQELSDRLARLKEMESQATQVRGGFAVSDLRESLLKLHESEVASDKQKLARRLEHLSNIGGTPEYLLHPPKKELVEQYFHPDNMSAGEKMKLELKKVRDEFKMSESDCGSSQVQIAQLTTKIKYLSSVLVKKDKHSRKGLHGMVQKRRKLLKYLRRTNWDSYCFVLSKLGLRDKPDYKA